MRKGFTLLEILIVIGISVALLSFGALSLNGLRSGQSIESEARQLVAVLQSAQEKSIGQDDGSNWGVYFDTIPDRDIYYLYQVDQGIPDGVIDTHILDASMDLELPAPDQTLSVIFSKATGQPTAAAAITITDGNPETARNVTISAQGRIDYE